MINPKYLRYLRYALSTLLILAAFIISLQEEQQEAAEQPPVPQQTSAHKDQYAQALLKPLGWKSPAGLVYGGDPSPKFANRIEHVMAHTRPDDSKRKHSVFVEKNAVSLLKLIDKAWQTRGPPQRQGGARGRDVYTVAMGKRVGEKGQRHMRIVTESNSGQMVTAYPVFE